MNVNMNDLTITSIETITALHVSTGAFRFTLDELQSATISQSQEKTDITGKQGRKLGSLKKNKAVKITGTNGLVSAGLMELQTGSTFETNKDTSVRYNESLDVAGGKATTTYVATGTTGNEIPVLHLKNEDGTLGEALTQSTAASSGKFAYNPTTKELTFDSSDVVDGTEKVFVSYTRTINGSVMENFSDTYSAKCELFVDAIGEDPCTNKVFRVQFHIPNADFDGNFELAMGDNQTVHAFEAEATSSSCGSSGNYFTFTIFGDEDV